MKKLRNDRQKGITLIALVVTIVVLIILATVSILAVFGYNGIIARAQTAKDTHEVGKADETNTLDDYASYIGNYLDGKGGSSGGGTTKPAEGITATVEGKTVTITKDNVADYLGKVVTNYVPTATTVKIGANTYTVSNNYRLYYIDFGKKYNKDEVSVFLKADCTGNRYALGQDTTASTADNVKIKALNPSLYKEIVTSPDASNNNMKAVTWLTNTSNWDSLKTGASLADKVNYVVGAPSVEIMMDSYNTKYGLTNGKMITDTLTASTDRVKLFYQYPTTVNSNNYGYEVGPQSASSSKNGYNYWTSNYTVKTDSKVDSMYYPGDKQYYWLASPSASPYNPDYMLYVDYGSGGYVTSYTYDQRYAFCPLVSLKSTVSLELQ